MIKFFRKIRQNLLSEGKTGKYLKYAIGEIFLVVIGILIALQINNWNEEKKARIQEQEYYCLLLENIEQDKEQVLHLKNLNQDRIVAGHEALREIQKEKPETVIYGKYWFLALRQFKSSFKPNDATYSDIKSSGKLNLIKDKTITNALSEYFRNVNAYSEVILSNSQPIINRLNNLESWFETGLYQASLTTEGNEEFLPQDIKTKLEADLPEFITESYKPKIYEVILIVNTTHQRRKELLRLIENEVGAIKKVLEKKCSPSEHK